MTRTTRPPGAATFLLGATLGCLLVGLGLPAVVTERPRHGSPGLAIAGAVESGERSTSVQAQLPAAGRLEQRAGDESASSAEVAQQAGASGAASVPAEARPTRRSVKVGILLLNIGNIARFGFGGGAGLSTEDQQRVWQAYIDDLNSAGGVHGQLITPVYQTYDVLSQDDMRRACLALTQDARVFVVLDGGGYTGPPVLCVTEQNNTPFLLSGSSGIPDEYFRRSGGLLFTLFQAGRRSMSNMVAELPRTGVKGTQKVGILSDHYGGIKETPDQLQAALLEAKYDVVYRDDLSGDLQTGTTEIPLAVQQMRARGVELVVNIANAVYATQFVQEAASQGWHPHYVSGDWNGGSTDFYMQNMPDSFDGNHTITGTRANEGRARRPQPTVDARCTKRAERALGVTVPRDSDAYGMYVRLCSMVHILQRALQETGPDLSVATFISGTNRAGRLQLAGFGGGSYTTDRADAIDHVRVIRWSASCKCQLPINDFRPTRH